MTAPTLPTTDVSSSVRQAATLRAGIELLARIGSAVDAEGVRLSITSYDFAGFSPKLVATICHLDTDEQDRWAGIRAAQDALDVPMTVAYSTLDALGLQVECDIAGVKVLVTARFTGDEIPPILAAFNAPAVARMQASAPGPDVLDDGDEGPTPADFAAITAEQPLIEAELAVVDAEIAVASDGDSELAGRRLAGALQNLATVAAGFEPAGPDMFRPVTPLPFHPTLRSA